MQVSRAPKPCTPGQSALYTALRLPQSPPHLHQVREFAAKMIAPHAEEVDRTNSFPKSVDLWREMGSFGLLGVTAPAEYGGLGLGYAEHCIAMEEISRASGAIGLSYGEKGCKYWSIRGKAVFVMGVVSVVLAHFPLVCGAASQQAREVSELSCVIDQHWCQGT